VDDQQLTLRWVPPPFLEEAWGIVNPGLEKVKKYSFEDDFCEQIKAALSTGVAHLFLSLSPEGYTGFVVLRPEETLTGLRGLHIWAAYSENSGLADRLAEVEQMAREGGFHQVSFSSSRRGWARRLKEYEPTYQIYRKVLDGRTQ
jgi:hypothetical protein